MTPSSLLLAAVVAMTQTPTQVGTDTIQLPGLGTGLAEALAAAGEGIRAASEGMRAARLGLEELGAAWTVTQDPADSLFRTARRALNRGEYRRAVELFHDLVQRHARSSYAGDALYWEAFALYRLGGTTELRAANGRLQEQGRRYPDAATRKSGDTGALAMRIDGELARRGDADASARVHAAAQGQATSAARATASSQRCPAEDDDDDPRVAALSALLQMDADNALPILERVLERRDDCSAGLRRKAVFLVAQKRSPRTAQILLETVRSDPDREVRENAIFWLSQVPGDETVAILDSVLQDPQTTTEIQEKAVFALSQQSSPKASERLRDYAARDGAPVAIREQAIFWLGQRKSPETGAFLQGLYPRLTEPELREKVVFSLAQLGGEENTRWLLALAKDAQQPIDARKQAVFWAAQSKAPLTDLIGLYDAVPDLEMREQLIFVYSQRKDPAAIDKLFDIARRDPNPELRRKAIFWIGQSKDPRVPQFLNDLINEP